MKSLDPFERKISWLLGAVMAINVLVFLWHVYETYGYP